jgi:hypothetical protein
MLVVFKAIILSIIIEQHHCSFRKEFFMNRLLSFFAGVVSGALVGAVVAILLAPSSGEDLRIQIQERATYVQDEVKKAATDRRAELEEQLATLRSSKKPVEPV